MMDFIQKFIDSVLPTSFDPGEYFLTLLIVIAGILILGGLFRLWFGKGSILNISISSAIAIMCLYVLSALIFIYGDNLKFLFDPLPFVSMGSDNHLQVFRIFDSSLNQICTQVINMLILSYLMNLLDFWLPKGKKIWSWYGFRILSLILAICLYYCMNLLLNRILPATFWDITPVVLLGILLLALLLGILKLLIGGALAFLNPLLGLLYAFFFRRNIGKQLTCAMVTTALLTALVCVLNTLSITEISMSSVALLTYLPVILLGLLLWYVLRKLL